MRLHDIQSASLLPRFAEDAEWEQNALDDFIKSVRAASFGLGAPYTMKAIEALSDADLQKYYAQYGIATYYPDLSRKTRNDMLFELARIYRYLGTPYAVQLLCRYIFDESEAVTVEVVDNIAWENGELTDSSLLDLFDLEISFSSPVLTPEKHERIIENVFRFCRNSQTLRDTIYIFPGEFSLPVGVAHGEHAGIGVVYENEVVAQLPPMGYIVLNSETGAILGAAKGHELETVPIPACTIASPGMERIPVPARVLESPEMVVYVPTAVDLPEVTEIWTLPNSSSGISTIQSGYADVLWGSTTPREQIPYDVTSCYAVVFWRKSDNTLGGRTEFSLEGISNVLAARNVSSSTIEVYWIKVAVCSSNQATVVPVYDSSNNAYNAFKYTTNNTDYYYVLDETQTDWTDDLSSIGYSLEPEPDYLDVFFYYNADGNSVTFAANDYWATRIRNDSDKAALENFGVPIGTSDSGQQYVARTAVDSFTFTPIALYAGDGFGDLQADMSNFYCGTHGNNQGSLYYGVCILSTNPYGTNTQTWKCRITRINGGN
jgi:hypothetical protein